MNKVYIDALNAEWAASLDVEFVKDLPSEAPEPEKIRMAIIKNPAYRGITYLWIPSSKQWVQFSANAACPHCHRPY